MRRRAVALDVDVAILRQSSLVRGRLVYMIWVGKRLLFSDGVAESSSLITRWIESLGRRLWMLCKKEGGVEKQSRSKRERSMFLVCNSLTWPVDINRERFQMKTPKSKRDVRGYSEEVVVGKKVLVINDGW